MVQERHHNSAQHRQEIVEFLNERQPTLGTEQSTASGTSVTFTGIPSWVSNVVVMLNGTSVDGTDDFIVQLGDSGGIETSGYVGSSGRGASATSFTAGFGIKVAVAADIMHGALHLYRESDSNDWVASGSFGATSGAVSVTGGSKTLSGALTQLLIKPTGTDNFDAGSINIQYR